MVFESEALFCRSKQCESSATLFRELTLAMRPKVLLLLGVPKQTVHFMAHKSKL